jgi:hypothetical protein
MCMFRLQTRRTTRRWPRTSNISHTIHHRNNQSYVHMERRRYQRPLCLNPGYIMQSRSPREFQPQSKGCSLALCKLTHSRSTLTNSRPQTIPGFQKEIFAHSGFLACATTLLPWLTEEIIRQVTVDDSLTHIVFAGHSAGGAVAALVFLHFICRCPNSCESG